MNSIINKKALLLGSYGQDNIGDDILLFNYVDLLKTNGYKEIYINVANQSYIPDELKDRVSAISTYNTGVIDWLKILYKVDLVVYGGGSILKELYKTTNRSKYGVIFRIFIFNLVARILGKKIINLNIGIGFLKTKFGHFLTKYSLVFSNYSLFRDEHSYKIARDLYKLDPDKIELGNDGIFINKRWNAVATTGSSLNKVSLTIGINMLHDIPDWIEKDMYVAKMITFCNLILRSGHHIVFLPFQSKFNTNNDYDFIKSKIIPYLINKNFTNTVSNIENICKNVSSVDVLVGMRFHSLLVALSTATPFVAIDYDTKCTSLIKKIENLEYVSLEDFDPEKMYKMLMKVATHRSYYKDLLEKMATKLYEENNQCQNILLKI